MKELIILMLMLCITGCGVKYIEYKCPNRKCLVHKECPKALTDEVNKRKWWHGRK